MKKVVEDQIPRGHDVMPGSSVDEVVESCESASATE
jgi:hypothetical protein